jgi:hypothetical protein
MTVLKQYDDDSQQWETIVVGKQGPGVPSGGDTYELLAKVSGTDFDTEWTSEPTVDGIIFDVAAGLEANVEGEVVWDDEAGTLAVGINGGATLFVGEETLIRVTNQTGVQLSKGTLLAYDGTVGNSGRLLVKKAVADGTDPSKLILGVALRDIPDDEDGYAVQQGRLKPFNTTATDWVQNDILWADPAVDGGLTRVEPAAPNLRVAVAVVVSTGASGTLYVRVTPGSSLADDELVTLTSLQDGDTLLWDAGQGRFENGQPPTALVDSVNGQVGDVVLDATDVGAYPDSNPDSYIDVAGAPVQSVNGASGTVVLDYEDVGAIGTAVGLYVFDYGTAIPDTRPTALAVYWRGTAEPGTAIADNGDLWYDTTGDS